MPRVMLYERVPDAWFEGFADFLRERQPEELEIELVQPEDDSIDAMLAIVPEADVLIAGLAGQQRAVVRHVFEDAVRLKLLQKLGSRAEGVDVDAAREAGVPVSLIPAPAHVACAEHAILLMLAVSRKLIASHRAVADGKGGKPGTQATEPCYNWAGLEGIGSLAGKTLGLIGMGDIAVEVAWRANAFDMDVIYYDEEPLPEEEADELGARLVGLDDLLIDADIVSLHAALTPTTEGLLDAEHLGLMKPTAILINTARGGIVDERALARMLREGQLAGAGIDAWAAEPPSKLNPLLKLDNVVATPHVAAGTLPPAVTFETLLPNILAALRGEALGALLTPQAPTEAPEGEPDAEDEEPTEEQAIDGPAGDAESVEAAAEDTDAEAPEEEAEEPEAEGEPEEEDGAESAEEEEPKE